MKDKEDSTERFFPVGYELMCCEGMIDKDGKEVKLSLYDKIIYSYLKARIKYFVNERKGDYFDTQERIAYNLSFSLGVVRKSIKKFFGAGVLKGYKAKWNNYENWRYTSIEDLKTYRNNVNEKKGKRNTTNRKSLLDSVDSPF